MMKNLIRILSLTILIAFGARVSYGQTQVISTSKTPAGIDGTGEIQKTGVTITSIVSGGNWNNGATWSGGAVPGAADNVIINTGTTVIISSGLPTCKNITINGTLNIVGACTLQVNGNWMNNGTFNAGTNGIIEFAGSSSVLLSGRERTNFNELIINKGSDRNTLLEINRPVTLENGGKLTVTNGLLKINGSGSLICYRSPVEILENGGVQLDGGALTTSECAILNKGLFQLKAGTATLGMEAGISLQTAADGTFQMDGGRLELAGALVNSAGTASITAGILNIATVGQPNSALASFDMSGSTNLNITGGTVIFSKPKTTGIDSGDISIAEGTGSKVITGGTFQMGNAATPPESTFLVKSAIPLTNLTVSDVCTIHVLDGSKPKIPDAVSGKYPEMVFDKQAPSLIAPPIVRLKCTDEVPAPYVALQDFIHDGGLASDNCTIAPESFKLIGQEQSSPTCPYTLTRTYQVADQVGNIGTAKHIIVVSREAVPPPPEKATEPAKEEVPRLKSAMASYTAVQSGNWSDPATWGGTVPTAADDVTIPAGITVTVDGSSFCRSITISGTLNHAITATTLQVNGSWTNNGTYNGGTNGIVEFAGTTAASINGTTNFEELIVNKGSLSNTLIINGTATVLSSGKLTMTSGLVTIPAGGSFTVNPASGLAIPAIAGFDVTGGTLSTGNFTITNEGLIRISAGTANLGNSSGNEVHTQTDGAFIVSGGAVNIAGRLYNSASGTLNPPNVTSGISISGGIVTLATVGNGLSGVGSLNVTSAGNFNFTGGTIVFQNPSNATTELDLGLLGGTGTKNTVGGTFQFGNTLTLAGSVFDISSEVTIDKITSSANADLKLSGDFLVNQLALNSASSVNLNGNGLRLGVSGTGTYTFPIDNGSGVSIPVTVTLTGGSVAPGAYIEIETISSKHPNNASSVNYLSRYWIVTTSGITNPVYDITATYANADIAGTESKIAFGNWTSSLPWIKGSNANTSTHTVTQTGISATNYTFTGITSDPPTVTVIAAPSAICIGSSSNLTATSVGDGPFSYSWSPSTGLSAANIPNPVATPTATTIYSVTVTDANGFTASDAVTVDVNPDHTITLTSAGSTTTQTVCINTAIANITYSLGGGATGATVTGLPSGVSGSLSGTTYTISGTPTASGIFNYKVTTTGNGCIAATATGTITVHPDHTITLTSAGSTTTQTVCINTAIANITYSLGGGATGATVTGLPSGVSGSLSGTTYTISGTPTASGIFNYKVTTTGNGCIAATATGTITITPDNTITLSSAAGTNAQSTCINAAIANITYSTTGATGANFAGLPSGVNGSWASNVITISGTPTASGTFNYTVTLTGGCGNITATGTITVTTPIAASATITDLILCFGSAANVKITASGGTPPYTFNFQGKTSNSNGIFTGVTGSVSGTDYSWSVTDALNCAAATGTLTVTEPAELTATAAVSSPILCNGGTGTVTITASGGTAPLSYTLNGITNSSGIFTGMIAGTYNWSVKDANNCTPVSGTVPVTQPTVVGVTSAIVTSPILCNGGTGTVTITATGGTGTLHYTFNGQTNTSGVFSNVHAGTGLSYSVTDDNGCGPAFGSLDVTQPASIAATAAVTSPILCNGGTATVTITASGGSAPLSYTFNGTTNGTGIFSGIIAGNNYTWSVTDANNCTAATGTLSVTQPNALTASVSENTSITCYGGSAEIKITASGGTGAKTYVFNGVSNATGTFTGIAAQNNIAWSVTDANACSVSGTYNVVQPTQIAINSISSNSAICQGSTLNLTSSASGGTGTLRYNWAGPNGFTASNAQNPTIPNATPAVSGAYTLTVTDANNCTKTATIDVVVNPTATMTDPADQVVCNNSSTTAVTFAGADSYTWTNNNTSIGLAASGTGNIPSFTATNTTNAPVTATITVTPTSNSCPGTPQTFTITVNPIPVATATPASSVYCRNSTTNIALSSNVAGTTFTWTAALVSGSVGGYSDGSGSAIIQNLTNEGNNNNGGIVEYTITPTANGCVGFPIVAQVELVRRNIDEVLSVTGTSSGITVCPGEPIQYNLQSQNGGNYWIRFSWQNDNPNVGLAATGGPLNNDNRDDRTVYGSISFIATNSTSVPQTANIVIIASAYRDNNNSFLCDVVSETRTITVNPFTIVCPADYDVSADAGTCHIANLPIDNPVLGCPPNKVTWQMSGATVANSALTGINYIGSHTFNVGTTTVDYSAQDAVGNTASCTFTVTVTDDEPPTISNCPSNISKPMDAGQCGAAVTWTTPTATDNCTGSVTLTRTDGTGLNSGDIFPAGTTTISYLATDAAGKTSTCSFTVTVAPDAEAPVISCVGNQSVCAAAGSKYTNTGTGWDATATDNCSGTITRTYSLSGATTGTGTSLNNMEFNVGTTTVTWTAKDVNNNPSNCTFNVVVNEMPTVSIAEGNQSVCLNGSVTFTATATGTPAPTYQWRKNGTAISGQTSATLTINPVLSTDGANYDVVVTNSCGSATSAPVSLSVSSAPAITVQPANQTDCLGESVVFNVAASGGNTPYLYAWEMRPTSGDAWSPAGTNADNLLVSNIGDAANPGGAEYRVTVTDACGNSETSSVATLTVNQIVPQSLVNTTVCQGGNTTFTVSTSGSTPVSYQWRLDGTPVSNGGPYSGATSPTLTITNAQVSEAGTYSVNVTFNITQPNNNGAGVTTCAMSADIGVLTVDLGPAIVATPASQQICPGSAITDIVLSNANGTSGTTYSWTRDNTTVLTGIPANGTGATISGTLNSLDPKTLQTTTFTITATANTCVSTSQVTVTVGDDQLPVVTTGTCPANISVGADAGVCGAVVNYTPPTFDDNCDGSGKAGTRVAGLDSGATFPIGTTTVTWQYTDAAGNGPVSCSFDVTVTDDVKPNVLCKNFTVQLDASGNATITPQDVDGGSTDNCVIQTLSLDKTAFDCTNLGPNTVTLTATDGAGKTASCNATVTIADDNYPVAISASAAQTVIDCYGGTATVTISATGGVGTLTYTFNGVSNGTGVFTNVPAGTGYAWSVTNPLGCGNTSGTFDVVQPAQLSATIASTDVTCSSGNDGSITISSPMGGSGSFDYTIDGGANWQSSPVFMNLAPGFYDVRIRDANATGCVITLNSSVQVYQLTADINHTDVTCYGANDGTVTISNAHGGSNSFEYSKDGGSTWQASPNFSGLAPGFYNVQIRDANETACVLTLDANLEITQPAVLSATVNSTNVTCFGNADATITISSPTGGYGTYEYSKDGGTTWQSSGSFGSLTPGTYVVEIRDAAHPSCIITLNGALIITEPPLPTVSKPADQTVCNNATVSAVTFSGSVAGTIFDWVNDTPSIGLAAGGTGNIASFTASNPGNAAITATITVTPSTVNGTTCYGNPETFTITVNPSPDVVATPASEIICTGNSTSIALSSNLAGTTFNWTVVQSGVSGASAGTGSAINQTLTLTSALPGTATYTVTPSVGGCDGTPVSVVITVNPLPTVVFTPSSQTICSGDITGIALTSNLTGTTYSWTVSDSPSGSITGAVAGNGSTIAQTLINTTAANATLTYTVTPFNNGCSGTPADVVITVKPLPTLSSTLAPSAVCSGGLFSYTPTSNTSGATFSWTRAAVLGIQTPAASGVDPGVVNETLTNITSSAIDVTYVYTITANGCTNTQNVVVQVLPALTLNTSLNPPGVCSGSAINYNPGSAVPGVTFTWSRANVTGISNPAANGTGSITEALINTTSDNVVVPYVYTLTAGSCTNTQTVNITIKPSPELSSTLAPPDICNNTLFTYTQTSATSGTTFQWSRQLIAGISNPASAGVNGISETLINTTANPVDVTYEYHLRASGCDNYQNVVVRVNPTPVLSSTLTPPAICSNTLFNYSPASTTTGTTFAWSRAAVAGISNGAASGTDDPNETLINTTGSPVTVTYVYTLTANGCSNSQNVNVSVNPLPPVAATAASPSICEGSTTTLTATGASTYTWSPAIGLSATTGTTVTASPATTTTYTVTGTDANGCVNANTVTVNVWAKPNVTVSAASGNICYGTNTTLTASGAVSYTWSPATGLSATTGATVTASPTTNTTYTVTGTDANGCTNTATVTVSVLAPLTITATASPATICQGNSTTLTASGAVSYVWSPDDNLSSTTGATITASPAATQTYTVVGTDANGCTGTQTVTVTVNPLPVLTNPNPDPATVCSGVQFNYTPQSSVAGTTFSWTRATVAGISNASSSGTGNISETLINTTANPIGVTYVYTLSANGCTNPVTYNVVIVVIPAPTVTALANGVNPLAICEGSSVNLTSSSSLVSSSPTLLSSNFNSGSDGWAVGGTAGAAAWALHASPCVYGGNTYSSNDNSQFYFTASNGLGSVQTTLTSPTINTNGYTTLQLDFWQYYNDNSGNDFGYVEVSTNNGVTYNAPVFTNNFDIGNRNPFSNHQIINLSAYINYSQVKIRFRYVGNNDRYWGIDNVSITGTSANNPIISWSSNPSGFTSNVANPPAVTPTVTTTYTVTYTDPLADPNTFCPGSASVTVTVNPKPVMTSPNSAAICSSDNVNLALTSDIPATFSWVATSNPSVTGESTTAKTGNTINDVLTNTTTNPVNVIYTVTPTSTTGGCVGNPQTVTVTVNPTPTVNQPGSQTLCSGSNTTAINFTGSAVAGTVYTWTNDNPSIGLASSGTGNIPSFMASNAGTAPTVANIVVTPTYTNAGITCSGNSKTFTITVNPIPNLTIDADYCTNPGKIILTANPTGLTSYTWYRDGAVGSIGTGNPLVVDIADRYSVVATNSYGCSATAYSPVANEMVVNGDFTAGNASFISTYNYKPDLPGLVPAGQGELYDDSGANGYSISTNGQNVHINFWGIDHTNNTVGPRNFMLVNGHGSQYTIWQQTVNVTPNTNYYFSAWAMSVNAVGPYARLRFEVNGVQVGTTAVLGAGPNTTAQANANTYWTRFYSQPLWNSGALSGPITIRIVNLETALNGNDFALDDISFGTLDPILLPVTPTVDGLVCENGDLKLLANNPSSKPPFTFSWTGPNGWTSTDENPVIHNATAAQNNGTYTLTFTDGYGCGPRTGSVDVTVSATPVCSISGPTATIPNATDVFTTPAGMASYFWSVSGNGSITGPANGATVSVVAGATCAGSYTLSLTITNASGCSNTCTQVVSLNDTSAPVVTGTLSMQSFEGCSVTDAPAATSVAELEALPGGITVNDAFTPKNLLTVTYSDVTSGTCPLVITRTYTVTDACGNSVTIPQTLHVDDTTIPVITGTLSPATATGCSGTDAPAAATTVAQLEALPGGITVTDNCTAKASLTVSSSDVSSGTCPVTVTRTYTVKDACGNAATVVQNITVQDNVAPVITGTLTSTTVQGCSVADAPAPATTVAQLEAMAGGISINDACSAKNMLTVTSSDASSGTCAITLTRTYTITDACGNSATLVHTIVVQDNTGPVWSTPAGSLNEFVECSNAAGLAAAQAMLPAATDNCGGSVTVTKTAGAFTPSGSCTKVGTYINTFVATDNCGNASSTFTQIITTEDNTIPDIVAPPTAVISCLDDPTNLALTGSPTVTDNCDTNPTVTHSDAPVAGSCAGNSSIIRTWTVTDCNGNSNQATQEIYLQDVGVPVISALPAPSTISCDATPNWTTPTATDACDPAVTLTHNDVTTPGSCANTYSVKRTWTATDCSGNSATASQTINVQDVTAPVITCPGPVLNDANSGLCYATGVVLGTATATDNCGTPTITNDAPAQFPVGVTTVTWTATDACGNTATCTQQVTIHDITPPGITVGCADITDVVSGNGCSAVPGAIQPPTLTDNCWAASSLTLTYTMTGATTDSGSGSVVGQTFNVGKTKVTYIVSDPDGNKDSCSFNVTIKDVTPPNLTANGCTDVTETTAPNNCSKVPVTINDPTYSDNCWPVDSLKITWKMSGATTGTGTGSVVGKTFDVGTTKVTYVVSDPDGNKDSCSFNVTIRDVTPPNLAIGGCSDVTENAAPNNCSKIPVTIADPTYSDNCWPVDSLTITWKMHGATAGTGTGSVVGQTFNVGTTKVTYVVSDPDGNRDSCSFNVTIKDVTPPNLQITGCQNVSDVAAANNCTKVPATLVDPVYTDTCWPVDSLTLSWTMTGATTGSGFGSVKDSIFNVGVTHVIYTVTDPDGNYDDCSFDVTIVHTAIQPANFTCPTSVVNATAAAGTCGADVTLDPLTYTDPCNEIDSFWNNSPFRTSASDASGNYPVGSTSFYWYITDISGNKDSCKVTVIVADLPPTITCPPDVVTMADYGKLYKASVNLQPPVYGDNCPNPILTWTLTPPTGYESEYKPGELSGTGIYLSPDTFWIGTTTIKYKIVDSSGSADSCTFTIKVQAAPDITCAPDTTIYVNVSCTSSFDPGVPVLNSGVPPIDWAWTIHFPDGTTSPGSSTGVAPNPGATPIGVVNFPVGTTTIDWSATNVSGQDVCTQTIVVIDTIAPTFTSADLTNCVDMLQSAVYTSTNPNPNIGVDPNLIIDPSPDHYTFVSGDKSLDLTNLNDNCCDPASLIINWRIDFTDVPDPLNPSGPLLHHNPVSGTGQPSTYGSDILLWGDGVTFADVQHTITYWVEDCHGNVSKTQTRTITVKPRPNIIKTN